MTVAQNEDMRRISAWAAIIAVPTAGLRYLRHELRRTCPSCEWRYGYPLTLLVIAAICLTLHRGFRRNGWL